MPTLRDMPKAFVDYYHLFELDFNAEAREIKRAWKRLARLHHPDRNQGDPASAERFKELNRAWRTLADPQSKKRYDRLYQRQQERVNRVKAHKPRPRPQPRRQKPIPKVGEDLRQRVLLNLEQFQQGCRLRIHVDHLPNSIEIDLPAGHVPGQRLILKRQGLPGQHGGPSGRLILDLQPRLPLGWWLKGTDLACYQPIGARELLLGSEITVTLPDFRVLTLHLPPSVRPGHVLRMRGHGIRFAAGHGDLLLHLEGPPLPELLLRPASWFRKSMRHFHDFLKWKG
jgi:DnaJ-class molecular chaperone